MNNHSMKWAFGFDEMVFDQVVDSIRMAFDQVVGCTYRTELSLSCFFFGQDVAGQKNGQKSG
jgi:hypothetical protein